MAFPHTMAEESSVLKKMTEPNRIFRRGDFHGGKSVSVDFSGLTAGVKTMYNGVNLELR